MFSAFVFPKRRDSITSSSMSSQRPCPTIKVEPPGLKTLANSGIELPIGSNCVRRKILLSPQSPPFRTPSANDVRDAKNHKEAEVKDAATEEEEEDEEDNACFGTYGRRTVCKFPPAIPYLARTNVSCHMPWVLERTYRDGCLVLHEVPVKNHEYIRTRRENGRLTLKIMRLEGYAPKVTTENMRHCGEEEKEVTSNDNEELILSALPPSSSAFTEMSSWSSLWLPSSSAYADEYNNKEEVEGEDRRFELEERDNPGNKIVEEADAQRRSAISSLMMLASSLPEPACKSTVAGASSSLCGVPASRMRAVKI